MNDKSDSKQDCTVSQILQHVLYSNVRSTASPSNVGAVPLNPKGSADFLDMQKQKDHSVDRLTLQKINDTSIGKCTSIGDIDVGSQFVMGDENIAIKFENIQLENCSSKRIHGINQTFSHQNFNSQCSSTSNVANPQDKRKYKQIHSQGEAVFRSKINRNSIKINKDRQKVDRLTKLTKCSWKSKQIASIIENYPPRQIKTLLGLNQCLTPSLTDIPASEKLEQVTENAQADCHQTPDEHIPWQTVPYDMKKHRFILHNFVQRKV